MDQIPGKALPTLKDKDVLVPLVRARHAMPETPDNNPPANPDTTLKAVLDAVSLRSAFALSLVDRIDRYRLIEATRLSLNTDADPTLVRELLGRRTEALLALAIYASRNVAEFLGKTQTLGRQFALPDAPAIEREILIAVTWTALICDGRALGLDVRIEPSSKSETPKPDTPKTSH